MALDYSFTMAQAASTHPDAPVPSIVAYASKLPMQDAAADCAVAFMCLHDIDDVAGVIVELGRVLQAGGALVIAIVHPLNSAGGFDRSDPGRLPPYVIQDAYTEARHYTNVRARDGLSMTYHGIHRPLQTYTEALTNAGFAIRRLREVASDDSDNKWSRIPLFLHIVASRLSDADR